MTPEGNYKPHGKKHEWLGMAETRNPKLWFKTNLDRCAVIHRRMIVTVAFMGIETTEQ